MTMGEEASGNPEPVTGGIAASARRLVSAVFGLARTRLDLIGVELKEEKLRLVRLLGWLALGLALGFAALLVAVATLALALWRTAGFAGLLMLVGALAGATVAVFVIIRRRVAREPAAFAATAAEFRKDVQWLKRTE
jgi:uncharacterized membrane protein YqjE